MFHRRIESASRTEFRPSCASWRHVHISGEPYVHMRIIVHLYRSSETLDGCVFSIKAPGGRRSGASHGQLCGGPLPQGHPPPRLKASATFSGKARRRTECSVHCVLAPPTAYSAIAWLGVARTCVCYTAAGEPGWKVLQPSRPHPVEFLGCCPLGAVSNSVLRCALCPSA